MVIDASRTTIAFFSSEEGKTSVENMHALRVGDDLYCLDNSPFYVYGVSLGDIVYAPVSDGRPVFDRVIAHQGHSTYRVRLPVGRSHNDFAQHWRLLEQLGCSYEGSGVSSQRLYSIDVPPGSEVSAVYKILEEGERLGWWEFEEAHYYGAP